MCTTVSCRPVALQYCYSRRMHFGGSSYLLEWKAAQTGCCERLLGDAEKFCGCPIISQPGGCRPPAPGGSFGTIGFQDFVSEVVFDARLVAHTLEECRAQQPFAVVAQLAADVLLHRGIGEL